MTCKYMSAAKALMKRLVELELVHAENVTLKVCKDQSHDPTLVISTFRYLGSEIEIQVGAMYELNSAPHYFVNWRSYTGDFSYAAGTPDLERMYVEFGCAQQRANKHAEQHYSHLIEEV